MSGFSILIIAIIIGIVFLLAINGKLRVLLKGFLNLFVEDMAKTPKGAEAIYQEAINNAEKAYCKASDNLLKISGKLNTAQNSLKEINNEIINSEKKCETLIKNGNRNDAIIFAEKRSALLENKKSIEAMINKLTPMKEEAEKLCNNFESKLIKLKNEKDIIINELIINNQTKEMYDDLDELKNVTNLDKMVNSVKKGLEDSRELAEGSRVVHNSKLSTKIQDIEQKTDKYAINDYLDSLEKKIK